MTELNVAIENIYMYVLVFIRLTAIIAFNPVFSRNNIPSIVRTGIIFFSTIILTPAIPIPSGYEGNSFELIGGAIREIAVGWLLGYVFNIFFYMLIMVSDILDMQFGLSMAKVMDPGTNVQSAFTGNLINLLFMAYFFVTNTHLALIKLAVCSYDLIPAGAAEINFDAAISFGIDIFTAAFSIAMRLALPFVAVELILEIGMGILMKLIPQIHIFVINMQFKILLAIVALFIMAKPITVFMENYIIIIIEGMNDALKALAS